MAESLEELTESFDRDATCLHLICQKYLLEWAVLSSTSDPGYTIVVSDTETYQIRPSETGIYNGDGRPVPINTIPVVRLFLIVNAVNNAIKET